MNRYRPLLRPLLACVAVVLSLALTYVLDNSLDYDFGGTIRAQAARELAPYDLSRLRVLNRAIVEVNKQYVEPERIHPKKMLLSGLSAIQRNVAPVLVSHHSESEFTIRVDDTERRFRLDDVAGPWDLSDRFGDVFRFLQERLSDEDIELREIEYTAVNGMLRTLDPHTILLVPDIYQEMQTSTRGEFGGLGIVISLRDGHLTVIEPMPNTPASRAGLERQDRIVKINDESTLNMPLSEAVSRLRGAPGSRVDVWIVRPGSFAQPRRFTLTRAIIQIDSVESKMLPGNIGYVRIKSFQGNTYPDLRRALAELHRDGMTGLVLDLRDNPGGLLDQAVRVSDTFLRSGTIVTTSSNDPSQNDQKAAQAQGTEPDYPMVLLVNGGSASASEIVAGALKAHDRAVVLGQRTFGKGSVQVLHPFQDQSALKLTIAHYLTPGDISIQGVGIVPDIAVDAITVDRTIMDLIPGSGYLRESDLRQALTSDRVREQEQAEFSLQYYLPAETRRRLREADPRAQEENQEEEEFMLRFSRELLSRSSRSNRRAMLREAQPVLAQMQQDVAAESVRELRRLGIDWTEGSDQGASAVNVAVSTNRPNNEATAGEPFELRVQVTNTGAAPLFRLRAETESEHPLFRGKELVFGKLMPGETRSWSASLGLCSTEGDREVCRLPKHLPDRADGIQIRFSEAHGHEPDPAELRTRIRALPRPAFAYRAQVADNLRGNGDGVLQRGESATLYFTVRNVGSGTSYETEANLRNLSGSGVLLRAGRFRIGELAPGESREVAFTFEVMGGFQEDTVKLQVAVRDEQLREGLSEKLEIALRSSQAGPQSRTGNVTLVDGAELFGTPSEDAERIAQVEGGTLQVRREAEADGGWIRVALSASQRGLARQAGAGPRTRPVWVRANAIAQRGRGNRGRVVLDLNHMPPELEIDHDPSLVTRAATVDISGRARDDQSVRDLYIFVDSRKVFYTSNNGTSGRPLLAFETPISLHPGTNYVTVVARENADVATRRTFVIRRDGPNGELLETPKFEEDSFLQLAAGHN